jgi:putative phosphoesterase
MRIAALYDIHGNLPALNAVLKELEEIRPDLVVIGGDIVSGPMPRQSLERLEQLNGKVHALRGNADREVVELFDNRPVSPTMPEEVLQVTRWVAEQLELPQRNFLAQLPEQLVFSIDGLGEILFCHATPRSDEEIFTPVTEFKRLTGIFAEVAQPFVICGHTHMQFHLQVGQKQVINAGSVGMPYAEQPGAYWLLLGPEGYELRRTAYDLAEAARQIRASGYPQALEFADENVLRVPTAAEAIEVFEARGKQ